MQRLAAVLCSLTEHVVCLGRPVLSIAQHCGIVVLIASIALLFVGGSVLALGPNDFSTRGGKDAVLNTTIDLGVQDPDLLIAGDVSGGSLGADLGVGDLDGDGFDDLVISAPWAHRASDERFAGHIYILFGGQDRPPAITPDQADVTIVGAAASYAIGGGFDRQPDTIAVGDINGDGKADLVMGAPEARNRAGEICVIFGRDRGIWRKTPIIDLSTSHGNVVISGADANDSLGSAVAVGDIDGDGIDDLIAGAPRADGVGNNRMDAGEVYIFSGRGVWPSHLRVAYDPDTRIVGATQRDLLGSGLATGELGGPEAVDLAIGARGYAGPHDDRVWAGEVYVLFGSDGLVGMRDLATQPPDWLVYAADSVDDVGRYLSIGDVSGDGRPDLVIGAPGGDGPMNSREDAGEVAVLFGPRQTGTVTDLAEGADFIVYGPQGRTTQWPGGRLGDNIALGDLDGDRVLDILAGARQGNGFGNLRQNAGEAYVLYGGSLPPSLDLSAKDANVSVCGPSQGDFLGRVAAGNLDGVPPDDLVLGAHRADTAVGRVLESAGKVFVMYQKQIEQTPSPVPTSTQTPGTRIPTPTPTATPIPVTPTSTPTVTPSVGTPTPTKGALRRTYLPLIGQDWTGE